ncbi:Protein of unknown function, partial [Gryllus bimaculatus]
DGRRRRRRRGQGLQLTNWLIPRAQWPAHHRAADDEGEDVATPSPSPPAKAHRDPRHGAAAGVSAPLTCGRVPSGKVSACLRSARARARGAARPAACALLPEERSGGCPSPTAARIHDDGENAWDEWCF